MIEAVTFDYWNTLVWEEPGRLVAGRLAAWRRILADAGMLVESTQLAIAHDLAFAEYEAAWRANRQYVVADATDRMLSSLALNVNTDVRDSLVTSFAVAGSATELHLPEGVALCLRRLRSRGVRLGIVCDVGLTPSPTLLRHLEQRDLLGLFDAWAFSDTVGVYKPDSAIFRAVLDELNMCPHAAAHVGDRLRTDVAGARHLGMVTIRYSGIYDDPEPYLEEADYVLADYGMFPDLSTVPPHG